MEDVEIYNYAPPVAQLLTIGKPDVLNGNQWLDYATLGLNAEHIPDLIRVAIDEKLNHGEEDNPSTWAPVHAWRALGQLRAEAAIEPLFFLFELTDEWHEWVIDELPEVYGMIGSAALPALAAYGANREHGEWPRVIAALSVGKIGQASLDARSASIEILSKQLESFQEEEGNLNAALIEYLVKLEAKEAAPLMERAFKANAVETFAGSDWEEVQEELGLLSPEELEQFHQRREAEALRQQEAFTRPWPKVESPPFEIVTRSPNALTTPSDAYWRPTPHTSAAKKAKHKDKVSKQARKKNRKR